MKKGLLIAGIVAVLDQASKFAALSLLTRDVEITSFFNLTLAFNRGVSFSMLAGGGQAWLIAMTSTVAAGLVVWLDREKDPLARAGLGLIIGGAVGNIIDRLRVGAVVDFLDFHIGEWHWPTFNAADSAICLGAALILIAGALEYWRKRLDA